MHGARAIAKLTAHAIPARCHACLCDLSEVLMNLDDGRTWLLRPYDTLGQPEARALCNARGGELLTIRDQQDTDRLISAMLKLGEDRTVELWIGLVRPDSGDWRWLSSGQAPFYTNWYASFPFGPDYASAVFNYKGYEVPPLSIPDGSWWDNVGTRSGERHGVACQLGEL